MLIRPRQVPLDARAAIFFGGALMQVGWALVAFGLFFSSVFVKQADFSSLSAAPIDTVVVDGTVRGVDPTAFSVGKSGNRNGRIYEYYFEYRWDGLTRFGKSYETGEVLDPGARVSVELSPSAPASAVIRGFQKKPFGPLAGLLLIIPLLGALIVAIALTSRLQTYRLITTGTLTIGRRTDKRPTNTRINGKQVFRLNFEYSDDRGAVHRIAATTHHVEALEDEDQERILYDSRHPARAAVVDALPGRVQIDDRGAVTGATGYLKYLIFPGLAAGALLLLLRY